MEHKIGRDEFVKQAKGTPCPALVWFLIRRANDTQEGPIQLLLTVAHSPTPFKLKNPNLKQALERLGLEWLTPSQISRIRECPAPGRKVPRHRFDRWFGRNGGVDPDSPAPSPKCKKLFWAWRGDQKTCDLHLRYASMLRVQKHRKARQELKRKARQLKDARQQLKRVRRANKRARRLVQAIPVFPATPSQLQAQNERADLQLLQWIRLGIEQEARDSERLEAMIRGGYVVPDAAEPQTYKLSGQGLQLFGQLKKRVPHAPER